MNLVDGNLGNYIGELEGCSVADSKTSSLALLLARQNVGESLAVTLRLAG